MGATCPQVGQLYAGKGFFNKAWSLAMINEWFAVHDCSVGALVVNGEIKLSLGGDDKLGCGLEGIAE